MRNKKIRFQAILYKKKKKSIYRIKKLSTAKPKQISYNAAPIAMKSPQRNEVKRGLVMESG
jgi:hypothetical protein